MPLMPLTWTTSEPTQPGWYWWRGTTWAQHGMDPQVRYLSPAMVASGLATYRALPAEAAGTWEWAGPLPLPDEPDAVARTCDSPVHDHCTGCAHLDEYPPQGPCAGCRHYQGNQGLPCLRRTVE